MFDFIKLQLGHKKSLKLELKSGQSFSLTKAEVRDLGRKKVDDHCSRTTVGSNDIRTMWPERLCIISIEEPNILSVGLAGRI